MFTDNRFTRRRLLSALSLYPAARLLSGQQGPPAAQEQAPKYSADVKVVNLFATVRNKSGKIINTLTKNDFLLDEEGRPQTIKFFERESSLPLYLGMMVDTSGSQRRVLDAERSACFHFLDRILRPNQDRVFIMQFDSAVQMRQELTSSRNKLDDALAFVDSETFRQLQVQHGGGTLLYDAVVRASKEAMKPLSGRKALIVLSDGVDFGSEETLQMAVEAAQVADTLVYSILFSDAGAYAVLVRTAREY